VYRLVFFINFFPFTVFAFVFSQRPHFNHLVLSFWAESQRKLCHCHSVFETDPMRETAQAGKSRDSNLRFGTKKISIAFIKPAEYLHI
jgi:hypothetical protein